MSESSLSVVGIIIVLLIWLAIFLPIAIIMVISMWKVFTKAGRPGWAALIPFYNNYVLLEISQKPGWWLVLLFIPLVNIVIIIMMSLGLAKSFGKGEGFAVGLMFIPMIFYPILAFGQAEYKY